ncbi:hypothetical protein [Parasedimentitalea huanghaiensis]|uniref:Uncharacterized protein n=1 Tax=Parasedimentitalea huanghaiensis TaxID=2682100 RepID=A0A6L6WHS2_9RHOB|nr:hypothetical protein [Zongyanglinia huanghaiensis]MVO16135.1 hypothetical protein [Zongyanglinia huanghaiensis]
MSPEIREAVRERSDALARGAFAQIYQPEYVLLGSLDREVDFAILGVVGSRQAAFVSASKHFFWIGCVAVAQFSVTLGVLTLEGVEAAVSSVSLSKGD